MPQGNPKPGELYLHFKQKLYQIVTVAEHSETGEQLVIYQALYGEFKTYARPFSMFISPVDKEKYPEVKQEYRFLLVEPGTEQSHTETGTAQAAAPSQQNGEKPQQAEARSIQEESAEEKLMRFFDADSMEEKYQILLEMRNDITDLMINNMAVVLDVVIEEGPLEQRYEELKTCIRTFQRYENSRLR